MFPEAHATGLGTNSFMWPYQSYPLLYVIWLLPLAGAILSWTFGPQLKRTAGVLGSAVLGLSFLGTLLAWKAATTIHPDPIAASQSVGVHQHLFSWMPGFDFGLLLVPLSFIWTLIITGVGFLILVYSVGYMWNDGAIARFFAYMNFFIFAMLTLVLSDNFVGLLVGWGLVGLASYFLIGFWFFKPTAVAAARKAFVINVVGDVAIMFAIFLIFAKIGSTSFVTVFTQVPALGGWRFGVCVLVCIVAAAAVPFILHRAASHRARRVGCRGAAGLRPSAALAGRHNRSRRLDRPSRGPRAVRQTRSRTHFLPLSVPRGRVIG